MTEMQMCPETKTGVKTTAQEMFPQAMCEKKMVNYNANVEKENGKKECNTDCNQVHTNSSIKACKENTNDVKGSHRDPFFMYIVKIVNKLTNKKDYKLGKANIPFYRIDYWAKRVPKELGKNYEVNVVWIKKCVHYSGDYMYYMTKDVSLRGDDADYIFRDMILTPYFNTKTYTLNDALGETLTRECVDFGTQNDDEVEQIAEQAFGKWVELIEDPSNEGVNVCDIFVRYKYETDSKNIDKKEFTEIQYDYQKDASDWIYDVMSRGNNEDCLFIVDCGGGKTSISLNALTKISKEKDYDPILLLSGLTCVSGAFYDDANKFEYNGKTVEVCDINKFDISKYKENKKNGIVTLVSTTCQSSVKDNNEKEDDIVDDNTLKPRDVTKLSNTMRRILEIGVRFSCGITDEAHKIVFGKKMKTVFDHIRDVQSINFLHMSGTGFTVSNRPEFINRKYVVDTEDIKKQQGESAVNKHMILCTNNDFLPFFENCLDLDLGHGWDMLLDKEIDRELINAYGNVDNLNCIDVIKSGLVTPVIGAYLSQIKYVKKSFDYLNRKYPYEEALIISANGCSDKKYNGYIRNDVNNNICKISDANAHVEITKEVRKAVAANKKVILLNVNKFVESWTIKEMNVQLMLRNISSPDTFGQAINRSGRIHKHNEHILKKDAFIFLYGDTCLTMCYAYDNIHRNNDGGISNRPLVFVSNNDSIYFNGTRYSYADGNIVDFRDILEINELRLNRSVDSFIGCVLENKFPDAIAEIKRRDNKCLKKSSYGGSFSFKSVTMETPNDDPANVKTPNDDPANDKTPENNPNEDNASNNKDCLGRLKNFIHLLKMEKDIIFTDKSFKYNDLVNGTIEHITNKENNIDEYERMLSECFGDEYESFKNIVVSWLKKQ